MWGREPEKNVEIKSKRNKFDVCLQAICPIVSLVVSYLEFRYNDVRYTFNSPSYQKSKAVNDVVIEIRRTKHNKLYTKDV